MLGEEKAPGHSQILRFPSLAQPKINHRKAPIHFSRFDKMEVDQSPGIFPGLSSGFGLANLASLRHGQIDLQKKRTITSHRYAVPDTKPAPHEIVSGGTAYGERVWAIPIVECTCVRKPDPAAAVATLFAHQNKYLRVSLL